MRFVLLAAACCALSSCASMSKSECVYADWRAIGFEDGAAGMPATVVSGRRQACAAAGVTPNMAEYLAGRDEGLDEYCTPANGFTSGEEGQPYTGACARHNETAFVEQHRLGSRLFVLRDRVRGANYALRQANEDLGATKARLTQTAVAILSPSLSVIDRATLIAQVKDLSEESERIERSMPALRTNLDVAQAELATYERQLASRPALVAAR